MLMLPTGMEVEDGGRGLIKPSCPTHIYFFPSDDLMMGGLGKLMMQW